MCVSFAPAARGNDGVHGDALRRVNFIWTPIGHYAWLEDWCEEMENDAHEMCVNAAVNACGSGNVEDLDYEPGVCGAGAICRFTCKPD